MMSTYKASENRYENMVFRRCGKSGIQLPLVSLGLWHNFGNVDDFEISTSIVLKAFDMGVTHFDLANNYGPPYGSAESNFGKIVKNNLLSHRDEMIISSKAGYDMWPGPYGNWGSRKYLISSCDQSLKRMGLDYVDIFYHHRPDPQTPIEETMQALDYIVRSGRALYAAISNYPEAEARDAISILKKLGTPCLIHQPKYSMFERWVESGLLDLLHHEGVGSIAFSPLAQGLLTDKYLNGIPEGSRAAKSTGYLKPDHITKEGINKVKLLNVIAKKRGQTLAQMAIAWLLKDSRVTSVLIGASSVSQLEENIKAQENILFSKDELFSIEKILQHK